MTFLLAHRNWLTSVCFYVMRQLCLIIQVMFFKIGIKISLTFYSYKHTKLQKFADREYKHYFYEFFQRYTIQEKKVIMALIFPQNSGKPVLLFLKNQSQRASIEMFINYCSKLLHQKSL